GDVEALQDMVAKAEAGSSEQQTKLREAIQAAEQSARVYAAALAKHDQADQVAKRVAELEARESELATEYERTEHGLHLIDQFVRAKAAMLTERINDRFELASFKLFEEQINGGLKATCVTTV